MLLAGDSQWGIDLRIFGFLKCIAEDRVGLRVLVFHTLL